MGSYDLGKDEKGSLGRFGRPEPTVFSWKAFLKRATWGGLLSPAREPAAPWPRELHQEAPPAPRCSPRISARL